ncbi:DoxX family protein [Pseudonocardia acaciae]|uniref:DoxX family protein n=1 Tax=Pseudonocardia acaciae TaxID=551276 RepID=UPI00048CD4C5|nr:DoxX family protein [Pseudonocardia acaciae]
MGIAYVVVAGVTILANAGIAAADFARARFVLDNSAEVGVPVSWLPGLAVLKAAGAAGLLLGLLGVPVIGTAAAFGLVAFFVGAVIAHVRARVFYNIAFPGAFLALAAASLVLSIAVGDAAADLGVG